MKNVMLYFMCVVMLLAFQMNCSKTSTTAESYKIPSGFVGNWTSSEYILSCNSSPGVIVDLCAQGITLTVDIKSDGQYTSVMSIPGDPPINESGSMIVEGKRLNINPAGDDPFYVNYVLAGDSLALTGQETTFDFDGDNVREPATANIMLKKK